MIVFALMMMSAVLGIGLFNVLTSYGHNLMQRHTNSFGFGKGFHPNRPGKEMSFKIL